MLHHGLIILGTPYSLSQLNKTKSGGTPYGPSHVESFNSSSDLTKDEYEIAKKTGSRLGKLVMKFND
jgi:NAD(P)H dehydrogenase (quinone)